MSHSLRFTIEPIPDPHSACILGEKFIQCDHMINLNFDEHSLLKNFFRNKCE